MAFEMKDCSALGPDLLTRCGVVHLAEEDPAKDLEAMMQCWCNEVPFYLHFFRLEVEGRYESSVSHTVQSLCKAVFLPLMLLVYDLKATGILQEAAQKLSELSSGASASVSRKTIKKRPVMKLSELWALPTMPCRVLFLRVKQAFQVRAMRAMRVKACKREGHLWTLSEE